MDFLELVMKRSSVRKYAPRPVGRNLIDKCLEAARLSPSACNCQPWQFIIVDKDESRLKLCKAMLSGVYGMNSFVYQAPVLVVVLADSVNWLVKVCNVLRNTKMYLFDIGIACNSFCLQASELGLGTCMLGWFNERKVKKLLSIPRNKRVSVVITLGYPDAACLLADKIRKSLAEIRRYAD